MVSDNLVFIKPHTLDLFKMQFEYGNVRKEGSTCRTIYSVSRRPSGKPSFRKRETSPQNVDLPAVLPKQKKKPYPIPLKQIKQASKVNKKLAEKGIERPLDPPKNGLHEVPVYGCLECSEVHVVQSGHQMQDSLGPSNSTRRSHHSWMKSSINDVLVPIEAYHQYDPFGHRIKHETRFQYDRIPAIVELCIQAGVDPSTLHGKEPNL